MSFIYGFIGAGVLVMGLEAKDWWMIVPGTLLVLTAIVRESKNRHEV